MKVIPQTTSTLTFKDHWGHVLARLGFRRSTHRVEPGLYALGSPDENAPVYVTANYTLSFDALRSALEGMHAYILVLDTKGVNVWCAAGKGTFGTGELVARVKSTNLGEVVKHRTLILPQLGATGVSAHLVKEQCGFEVEYGPVRAEDLPEYLETHTATPEMRQSRFNLADRLVLAPVEVVHTCLPMVVLGALAFLLGGWFYLAWALSAWLGATVLFFAVLPWLPAREFSVKGFILGGLITVPFAVYQFSQAGTSITANLLRIIPMGLISTALVAFVALNTTGSTPITSWTSVRREIFRYVPVMAVMAAIGVILLGLQFFGLNG